MMHIQLNHHSPSNVRLESLAEVCEYLAMEGTCKCGLVCPFHASEVRKWWKCLCGLCVVFVWSLCGLCVVFVCSLCALVFKWFCVVMVFLCFGVMVVVVAVW